MNLKYTLTGALAAALLASAHADVTVDITGATAFRVATLDSIKGRFDASGQPYKYAHDRPAAGFNGATLSIFQGTFPGVSGVTTIRTSFNGSVEGINAIVNSPSADPIYFTDSGTFASASMLPGGNELAAYAGATAAAQSEIAFSDVSITSTPFGGSPVLPADPAAGVVVFTMIANESAGVTGLTNVTNKQFQALFSNGFQPLHLFTGDPADTDLVFATGRNDGSGTRTSYMAETGLGITTLVNQFVVTNSTSTQINQIQRVPAGGGSNPSNASTIWGQDLDGNGGYSSGSALRGDLGKITPNVEVVDADGTSLAFLPLYLVTWLSAGDAVPAVGNGAKVLGYNGVTLTSIQAVAHGGLGLSTLDATDIAKVTEGQYTAWSYQQMYRRSDLASGDAVTVYNAIKSNLVLGTTGIPISSMHVSRAFDGGPVAP